METYRAVFHRAVSKRFVAGIASEDNLAGVATLCPPRLWFVSPNLEEV
jgi:hypothetical protein